MNTSTMKERKRKKKKTQTQLVKPLGYDQVISHRSSKLPHLDE